MGKRTNLLILLAVSVAVVAILGYCVWRRRRHHKKPNHPACTFQITALIDDNNIPKIYGKMHQHHEVPTNVTITSLDGAAADSISAELQGITIPVTHVGRENDQFFLGVTLPPGAYFPATMLQVSGCAALS